MSAQTEPKAGKADASPFLPLTVIALTMAVFTTAIFLLTGLLREKMHAGILEVDGKVLQAATAGEKNDLIGKAASEQELLGALLEASNLRDDEVFAVRLFDDQGKFIIGFPTDLRSANLKQEDVDRAAKGQHVDHLEPTHDISAEFRQGTHDREDKAVLRAIVPIFEDGKMIRAAEFLLVGDSLERQLREVDRYLNTAAFWFCIVGNLAIALPLALAFKRLQRTNSLLAQRTANLLRANHELTLAAKTSAVGAVAAHLIHGLKNPLFGLQAFVSGKPEELVDSDWQAAADSARRMQTMIADVVRILREEEAHQSYELSLAEAMTIFDNKVAPTSKDSGVAVCVSLEATGNLANRDANLVILALSNLAQNAIQASKPGSRVYVRVRSARQMVEFDVADQAGGLPERVLANLFSPCQSSKAGGTGLGLAITKQLASHLGGHLELVATGPTGTTFRLSVPNSLVGKTETEVSGALA